MKGIIWGLTYERGCRQMDKLIDQYNRAGYSVIRSRKTNINYEVLFDNQDHWIVTRANENSRGRASNIAYVDSKISVDFYNNIIKFTLKCLPYTAVNYFYLED